MAPECRGHPERRVGIRAGRLGVAAGRRDLGAVFNRSRASRVTLRCERRDRHLSRWVARTGIFDLRSFRRRSGAFVRSLSRRAVAGELGRGSDRVEDFGLPEDAESAAGMIEAAFIRARRGELVEVGCLGGIGRTGTVLACMAVLAGVSPRSRCLGARRIQNRSRRDCRAGELGALVCRSRFHPE